MRNCGANLVFNRLCLAEVAPQGDGVLYVAHGAAFYRTLTRLNAEQSRELKDRLEMVQYLRNAMQIATALRMYTEDYDEMLPPRSDDKFIALILSPYVRDQTVFQVNGAFAFRYTMDEQSFADIERPHEVVAGYLELSNGRVVIYADGHVKWQPSARVVLNLPSGVGVRTRVHGAARPRR